MNVTAEVHHWEPSDFHSDTYGKSGGGVEVRITQTYYSMGSKGRDNTKSNQEQTPGSKTQ